MKKQNDAINTTKSKTKIRGTQRYQACLSVDGVVGLRCVADGYTITLNV
jgi:hypothetical protein